MAFESSASRLYQEGASAYPEVTLSRQLFKGYLLEQAPTGKLERLSGPGLFLACACLLREARALERLKNLIDEAAVVLANIEPRPHAREEVQQFVLERLILPSKSGREKLREYRGVGSIQRWLKAVLVGSAVSLRRAGGKVAGRTVSDDAALEGLAADLPAADVSLLKESLRGPFKAAFQAAFAELEPRERNILRLHYLLGLTMEELAQVHSVHRATAVRWLSAARERLRASTLKRLQGALQLSRSGAEELAALLQSQLEASLRAAFGEGF